ncbi:MAG: hypothetical protein IKV30_02460 [Clostridia bacterium]|nr:hypothetical protein [Clostridia bacterium]
MKKLLSLFLVVVMLFTMVGCGVDLTDIAGALQKKEVSRGTINGNVYTNDFLGFTFTSPASWVYSTDEEIASLVNLTADTMLDEKFKDALDKNPAIYDMLVVDSLTGTNISVGYENLSKTLSSNITETQYADKLKSQLNSLSGVTYTVSGSYETVKLGETEFLRVTLKASSNGVSMTQAYYLHKVDGYMSYVIITAVGDYTIADVEAMFN